MIKKIIFILTLIVSIMLSACGQSTELSKTDFTIPPDSTKKGTLLFFWNPSGTPCQQQDKILTEEIIPQFKDTIDFVYVSTQKPSDDKLFYKYGIRSIPTIILLNRKSEIYKQFPPGIQESYILEKDINFIE